MKLYPRPAANHHARETRPTRPRDPHLPCSVPAPRPRRPSCPRLQITYNHREPAPTTETAPTSALHLSLHSRPPVRPACIAMPHLPVLPPCRPQSAPFAAKGTIRPPAPFLPFLRNKNPKNNHRRRGRRPPGHPIGSVRTGSYNMTPMNHIPSAVVHRHRCHATPLKPERKLNPEFVICRIYNHRNKNCRDRPPVQIGTAAGVTFRWPHWRLWRMTT